MNQFIRTICIEAFIAIFWKFLFLIC